MVTSVSRYESDGDIVPSPHRYGCLTIFIGEEFVFSLKKAWKFVVTATGDDPDHGRHGCTCGDGRG